MSEQTAKNLRSTVQFKAVKMPSGKKAFEAYCAVYENYGNNIVICAPTLEKLDEAWTRITSTPDSLNKKMAQLVWIIEAK